MMNKTLLVVTMIACASLSIAAQSDVVARLGSTNEEAHDMIFGAFSSGSVYMGGLVKDVFKTASDQAKAAMVTSVVSFARAYTASADFAKRWALYREEQKPEMDSTGPTSADAINAEQRKGYEAAIASMEQLARQMPQMKKDLDPQIAEMRKQLAALGKDKAANAQMDAMLKQGAEMQAADFKQRLAEWEKKYPVDPKPIVAARLREFLAASATVDYTAKLVKKDGLMRFENPAYERKDSEWKYMYRAGKPAVDAARAIAQEWLKTLGG